MTAANKRKGALWETDLLKAFRTAGIDAERLRLTGRLDEGDLVLKVDGRAYVVEAKVPLDLAAAQREASVEAYNYGRARAMDRPHFVAIHKRRGYPTREAYVVMPVYEWLNQIGALE